jgi:protein gp37
MIDPDVDDQWDEKGRLKIARFDWPLPNVWLGVSTEDQARANERIPDLLATPAARRFISAEPLLGKINLRRIRIAPDHHTIIDALDGYAMADTPGRERERTMLDWVIAGGESGPKARASHPDWFRSLRDQCAAAGVPYFFKQWGSWGPSSEQAWIDDDGSNRHILVAPDGRHGDTIADMLTAPRGIAWMRRVGKKAAGAELDGKAHRDFPR